MDMSLREWSHTRDELRTSPIRHPQPSTSMRTTRPSTPLGHILNSQVSSSGIGNQGKWPAQKLKAKGKSQVAWQEYEIPDELELLETCVPREIRDIIQDSMDEHRATRASRSQSQAIVVRTTFETSRSRRYQNKQVIAENTTMVSSRSSPATSDFTAHSCSSLGDSHRSDTSLEPDDEDDLPLPPPSKPFGRAMYNRSMESLRSQNSRQNMRSPSPMSAHSASAASKMQESLQEPTRGRRLFRVLRGLKGSRAFSAKRMKPSAASDGYTSYFDVSPQIQNVAGLADILIEGEDNTDVTALPEATKSFEQESNPQEEALRGVERQGLKHRELERLGRISIYFGNLRCVLDDVRSRQKDAIERRHKLEIKRIHELEAEFDLMRSEKTEEIDAAKKEATAKNDIILENLRKKHAVSLGETLTRHQSDRDALLTAYSESENDDLSLRRTAVLAELMPAQEEECRTLKTQQAREMQKWRTRGAQEVASLDMRMKLLEERLEVAERISESRRDFEMLEFAEWKWFDIISAERASILDDDERRMIESGSDSPVISDM